MIEGLVILLSVLILYAGAVYGPRVVVWLAEKVVEILE